MSYRRDCAAELLLCLLVRPLTTPRALPATVSTDVPAPAVTHTHTCLLVLPHGQMHTCICVLVLPVKSWHLRRDNIERE